jgi:hypothetical protein
LAFIFSITRGMVIEIKMQLVNNRSALPKVSRYGVGRAFAQ